MNSHYLLKKMDKFNSSNTTPQTDQDTIDKTIRPFPRADQDAIDETLRRFSVQSGPVQLPSSSQILERLYNDHGVRVRMVRRGRPNRVPTVREMIDFLAKKHDKLLEMEGRSVDHRHSPANSGTTVSGGQEEGQRCLSERGLAGDRLPRGAGDVRCHSEKEMTRVEKMGPLVIDTRRKHGADR